MRKTLVAVAIGTALSLAACSDAEQQNKRVKTLLNKIHFLSLAHCSIKHLISMRSNSNISNLHLSAA